MSSFSIALSGLTAASSDLDVTANNVANANTTGFKGSRAEFADVFAAGAVNLNTSAVGEGVRLAATAQQFTQGNISTTSSNLDLAISGDGFFTLQDPSQGIVYTRNGEFSEDKNGNVVTATGQALQVYPPTANGGFNTGALTNLNLQTAQSTPSGDDRGHGDLESAGGRVAAHGRSIQSQQSDHVQPIHLDDGVRLAGQRLSRDLLLHADCHGQCVERQHDGQRPQLATTNQLTFSSTGAVTPAGSGSLDFPGFNPTDGAAPMDMTFNFNQSTQFGGGFGVTSITQNGFTTGQLSTVSIDPTGVVSAVYTNGRSTQLGQLALANFPNPQGLKQLGNTNWAETFTSGTSVSGTAGSAGFGDIQSGALEASNVDLTTELVNMITAQRAFQANAQVITTANQLSETVININH